MSNERVFLLWQSCRVFEDISVPKCYKCQGYNHKSTNCKNQMVCGYCMGSHDTNQCSQPFKKCANCTFANNKYNKNYDVSHESSDTICPTYKYMLEVMRSKIDWNITMAGNIEVDLLDTLENMKENLDEAGESVGSDILKSKININGKIINLLHINISEKKNFDSLSDFKGF